MHLLDFLLKRLGLRHKSETQQYSFDVSFHPDLDFLAEQQQRSPDEVISILVASELAKQSSQRELFSKWESLTPREQQVAALTCLDYTNPQIAARLGLSVETVRTHTRNVQNKFNVNSKADLRVLFAEWDFSAWATTNNLFR
jgi:DNA-binding CsgD family transcriptional regulator